MRCRTLGLYSQAKVADLPVVDLYLLYSYLSSEGC